jgi:hypothetical protein
MFGARGGKMFNAGRISDMSKRPLSVTIIGWLFIVFGSIALVAGLLPRIDITVAQRIVELKTHWYVHASRILMILSGVFTLYGFNWGRWLLVAWLGGHVIISLLHSPFEMLVHTLFLAILLFFLFRPSASAYFRGGSAL